MIITQEKSKQVVQSHDFDSVNCTIDAEDMRYVASLLRNNYSNPPLAVVREISANALDANSEAKASRPIEMTIPSSLNPRFIVRDFGGGLSQEDIFGLYSKYGKSTKRSSNNYIGAFGIGKFAPLSYGSSFTCVSFFGGTKTSYNIFVNEDDDTKIVKLNEEPSSEPTGLSIEVAISDEDVDKFREVISNFFRFFPKEELPKFVGVSDDEDFLKPYEIVMEAEDKSWFIIESDQRSHWNRNHYESHAIMGRVHYPLNTGSLDFSSLVKDPKGTGLANTLQSLMNQDNLYIRFDIGQLKLHHSRESIEYNKPTQKEIVSTLLKIKKEIGEIAKEKLGNAKDLWDAKAKYAKVINALPYNLRGIFEDAFEWNGIKVNGMTFDRDYKFQDNVIITEYFKDTDSDATDGYKVRSQKTTRISPTNDGAIVFQDLKSNHGNALRARTLFKDDENCDGVTMIYCADTQGEGHLFDADGMQFKFVDKDRFKYTSNIEKAKLQSRGKAIRGESRGDVPLFELDVKGENRHPHRNTDFWLNCTESIDDLEQGNKTLIYVPIANYKVVEESGSGQEEVTTLGSLIADVKAILRMQKSLHEKNGAVEDKGEFDSPMVVGVRRKDCSKLIKTRWESWQNYKMVFCKQFIKDNSKKVVECEKALAFNNGLVNMDEYYKVQSLLDAGSFHKIVKKNLKKDHALRKVVGDIDLMKINVDSDVVTLGRVIQWVRSQDEEWVKNNVKSNYDVDEFNNNCKEVCVKYPLLANISECSYSYRNYNEDNFGKNIIDYVLLCDLV